MNTESQQKIIDKVRKLMALSKSPNEHEAALAAERAQAILAEYNLSMSSVDMEHEREDDVYVVDADLKMESFPWKRNIANIVGKMYFCSYFYTQVPDPTSSWRKFDYHTFVGAQHNIDVAKMMFLYLIETIERLAKEGARSVPEREKWTYQTSFKNAAMVRVYKRIEDRIEAAKKGDIKTEGGTNLPALLDLYKQAEDKAKAVIEKKVGKLESGKSRGINITNEHGWRDGKAAGDRIGLDTQVTGRSTRQITRN